MRGITRATVAILEGMAPGACSADRRKLLLRLRRGDFFENFSMDRRLELWSRVCSASRQCLIPSLFTFFEDRKLLSDTAGCIRKILDVGRKETIANCLCKMFGDTNQVKDRCIIQLSETTFGSVAGDIDARLDLGARQLWLAAFRNYKDLPASTQKTSILAISRTRTDESALHALASLAYRLGFESDKLEEILLKSTDQRIAESALLTARKPGQYVFHDWEGCVRNILNAFAVAVPVSATETAEVGDELKGTRRPPQRYGRPRNVDYENDKAGLFLPQMHEKISNEMEEMTSTFVRWSVYCAYFGTPPPIGSISGSEETVGDAMEMVAKTRGEDIGLALTGQELQLQQAKCHDTSQQVQQMKSKLMKLEQDETAQQKRLDEINRQIGNRSTLLDGLRHDIILEQEKLDHLKTMAVQGQIRLSDGQAVLVSEPPTLTARVEKTNLVPQETRRNTRLDFRDLMAHDPNREHKAGLGDEARGDSSESGRIVRIDFVNMESDDSFVVSDVLKVDPKNPELIERIATSYRRKGFHLFGKDGDQLNPKDCFQKVVEDGTHTIVLRRVDDGQP
jgi:hypothetical protein